MNIRNKLLEDFFKIDRNVSDYRQALGLLRRSGFLDMVRRFGFPNVINSGSDLNAMAHEGSWSNGFQTGVNNIEFFEELYANKPNPAAARISPTFGGGEIAKKENYLSEEEIQKLRNKGVVK